MLTALASITMEPLMFPSQESLAVAPQFGVGGGALDHLRVGAGQRDDRGRGIYHVDGAGDLGGGGCLQRRSRYRSRGSRREPRC